MGLKPNNYLLREEEVFLTKNCFVLFYHLPFFTVIYSIFMCVVLVYLVYHMVRKLS